LNLGNMILWLLCIFLGTEAVRRGQLLSDAIPIVGDNDLAPASLPRLLQQLLYTPREEFQVPGKVQKTSTSSIASTTSTTPKIQSVLETNAQSSTSSNILTHPVENQIKDTKSVSASPQLQQDDFSKLQSLIETSLLLEEATENEEEDPYLIKLPKPPAEDSAAPITGDNCTDEKIRIDRDKLKAIEKDIQNRETEKQLHFQWIADAQTAIDKVKKQINQTESGIALIDRGIKNLEQEKVTVLNKMRKDELAYSLEEAKASLKKLQEQSRGTEQYKEELGNQKDFVKVRIEKITSSLQDLQGNTEGAAGTNPPKNELQEGTKKLKKTESSVGKK